MSHAAIHCDASSESREALEGFFLTSASLAGTQENDDGSLVFFIPDSEWNSDLEQSLHAFCKEHTDVEFLGAEIIEDRDWNAEWEATVEPLWATTELVITPSWKAENAKALHSKYLITIDPKMSFGTGHHETTRLCLTAIEALDIPGRAVLDIGTGSGVLAMYALTRGAKNAIGIDTDRWSIENAIENRTLNRWTETQFEIRKGTLTDVVTEHENFEIVIANIHRNVLLEIADPIRRRASTEAYIVLSGILEYDAEEVRAAYERAQFAFVRELKENEWTCLVFRV